MVIRKYMVWVLPLLFMWTGVVSVCAQNTDTAGWYALTTAPDDYKKTSIVDLSHLLDKPAGRRGFLTVKNGRFIFGDGTPARFWGVNITAGDCFPDHATAERTAARLAKFGCNMARLHHMDADWAAPNIFNIKGGNAPDSRLSEESLERLDYFIYQLKKQGIYIFLDLLVNRFFAGTDIPDADKVERGGKIVGLFNEGIIALEKEYARQIFTHVNPYTKTRYAEEPAIALTDIINESTLFHFQGYFNVPATYLAELDGDFTKWCEASGKMRPDGTVMALLESREQTVARFLYERQTEVFMELRDYLRALGVKYPITGSNFYFNYVGDLLSNARLDFIDRHTYWDHPSGGFDPANTFTNNPMVKKPTSLTVGNARVEGKPFTVSEWNCCWMNEYITEGPMIMAAYGVFQGWDGVLQFDYTGGDWRPKMEKCFDIGNKPHVMAARIPAALMFLRKDAAPAAGSYIMEVNSADEKLANFLPVMPMGIPLVRRVGIKFVAGAPENPSVALKPGTYESDTRELKWMGREGIVFFDTPRTQGALGFIGGQSVSTRQMQVEAGTPFCQVVLSSLDGKPLSGAGKMLLTATARAENSKQVYNNKRNSLISTGEAPILMEPVAAKITFYSKKKITVNVLDHHGFRTGKTVPVERGEKGWTFSIGRENTFWYEVAVK
ncbi:MAG: hypothetical protein ACM3WV_01810 [Bacillota bacterium]